MREESGVISVSSTIEGFSSLFHEAILKKLGEDREALKEFEVSMYEPPNELAKIAYNALGKRLFNVTGFLALDDAGKGKAFQIQMEEGLTAKEDADVADQLAHQCLICVAKMKRERLKEPAIVI